MLKSMRKHAKYFYVLFVLVILTFMFWGVGTVDKQTSTPLAEIGSETLSLDEYWRTYDRMSDLYRDVYKERFDTEMQKELQGKVLQSLIDERLLLLAARQSGMKVSEKELQDAITSDSTFMREGAFNRDVYMRTLELNRLTPAGYEAAKRKELLYNKMKRLIEESVDIAPSEVVNLPLDAGAADSIKQMILEGKKQAALKSYVEGLKRKINVKVNKDLIS